MKIIHVASDAMDDPIGCCDVALELPPEDTARRSQSIRLPHIVKRSMSSRSSFRVLRLASDALWVVLGPSAQSDTGGGWTGVQMEGLGVRLPSSAGWRTMGVEPGVSTGPAEEGGMIGYTYARLQRELAGAFIG